MLSLQKEAPGQNASSRQPREAQPDQLSATVEIPKIYQVAIAGDKGIFFRNLRNIGVIVDSPPTPAKPETPRPTKSGNSGSSAPAGRIDDDEDDSRAPAISLDYMYEVFDRFDTRDTETVTWTLKSKDQAALDKAKERMYVSR